MFKNLILTMTVLILAAGVIIFALLSNTVPPPKSAVAKVNQTQESHIIPMAKPSPTPAATPLPKTHDYVYNAVEYRIAATGVRSFNPANDEGLAHGSYYLLSQAGYTNLSFQEVLAFFKKYRLREGDTVMVRARIVRKVLTTHVKLESPFDISCSNTNTGWHEKVAVGEIVTLKGTVNNEDSIFNCVVYKDGI